ncbi:uncharacterized protein BN658_00276 [Clostridium sp. CAG:440]|nr:uncharacterized protein BN658_00276 [Clostridium sp. CAG:440]
MKIVPEKLKIGDEIRIIAPSRSMSILKEDVINLARQRLEEIGLKVTFGKNVMKYKDEYFKCATIEERIEDLHEAFKDKNVKVIMTVIGGYNVNQILDYIDYKLIQENPKIICGFSDITALVNAIYAKTNMVTYLGLQFFSFGMKYGFEYSLEYFEKMFFENKEVEVEASKQWSNDKWLKNQENRKFINNEGMQIINKGEAEGKIIGGNLCTLNLLQGTEYMPDLDNSILFIEDDGETGKAFIKEFDRNLQSLLHCAKGKKIKGLVIGRAENVSEMNYDKWNKIIESKSELQNIPIIINADIGHTTPIFTFPIGGNANIVANEKKIKIKFSN